MKVEERSQERITYADLKALHEIAMNDFEDFIKRKPEHKIFKGKILAVALCQAAATHYIDRRTGIKDFDIWFFFKETKKEQFPYRRKKRVQCGIEKFGISPQDQEKGKKTRGVEIFGREIPTRYVRKYKSDPEKILEAWLEEAETKTAQELKENAVVGLYPDNMVGNIFWR